jgi:hypothetical protein
MFTACGLEDVPEIIRWICSLPDVIELCIGGSRESECADAYDAAKEILEYVISYGSSELEDDGNDEDVHDPCLRFQR